MSTETDAHAEHDDIIYPSAIPFVLVHLGCFGGDLDRRHLAGGRHLRGAVLAAHLRHRRRLPPLLLAPGLFDQPGVPVRARRSVADHRAEERAVVGRQAPPSPSAFRHRVDDVHSPRHKGFFYSHVGWIFARKHDVTDFAKIGDLTRYPELMWLHQFELLPAIVLAVLCFLLAGWSGLVVGFVWSTVLVYHAHVLHQFAGACAAAASAT